MDDDFGSWMRRGRTRALAMARRCWHRGDADGAMAILGHADRLPFLERRWIADQDRDAVRYAWPGAWSGAEPDDTDPGYLYAWQAIARGHEPIGDPLPAGDPLTVYRGQESAEDACGIAWTLDPAVARFFAFRVSRVSGRPTGVIITGQVARADVLGYVDNRNEREVIADPDDVAIVGAEHVTDSRTT